MGKYKYKLLYKPPIEELDDNNPDTWRKVFYIDKYECPSKLDAYLKLIELRELYNMKIEYMILEEIDNK